MKRAAILTLAPAALSLGACATQQLPEYVTSRDTLTYLHRSQLPAISLGAFRPREVGSLWFDDCYVTRRPGKKEKELKPDAYAAYIRAAMVRELTIGGKYSESAPAVTVTGVVDRITVSRDLPYRAAWNIRVTLTASNGRSMTRDTSYTYDGDGIYGPSACRNTVAAFGPAVQELARALIVSPEFAAMVGAPAPGAGD